MGMYFKDKTETLKAKLTIEQDDFLRKMAQLWGVSKSEALRIILNTYIDGAINNEDK